MSVSCRMEDIPISREGSPLQTIDVVRKLVPVKKLPLWDMRGSTFKTVLGSFGLSWCLSNRSRVPYHPEAPRIRRKEKDITE